jgi:hypothetical protein
MGMFRCAICEGYQDSHDGCQEAPEKYGKNELICQDCADELPDDEDTNQ